MLRDPWFAFARSFRFTIVGTDVRTGSYAKYARTARLTKKIYIRYDSDSRM
jgi:hypothetical protein